MYVFYCISLFCTWIWQNVGILGVFSVAAAVSVKAALHC